MRPDILIHCSFFCRLFPRALILSALAITSEVAFAQNTVAEAPGVSSGAILQMLVGLALIIVMLFAGAFLLRRMNGGKSFGNTGPMKVVGGLMISTRERIVLIEVGDSWLVVGIVPGQIKTLHTLPKGELPADDNGNKAFGSWFRQFTEHNRNNEQ